jgi:hypothetical protein
VIALPARSTRNWNPRFLFSAVMLGIASGYAAGLAVLFRSHQWILAAAGKPTPCDFLAFWVAGRAAISGHAASAYDIALSHAAQIGVAGSFRDFLYWNYPPCFFFVAALLAAIPYAPAFLGWVISTGAMFAATLGCVARRWEASLAACASPVILLSAFSGQNGFLSAAIFGGFLLFLPARPVLGGVLLGLMAYKPQFGVLIPFALVAAGQWRALSSAAVTAAGVGAVAALAFGAGTYAAFMHSLPVVSHVSLTLGGEGWAKMHSIYSVVRFFGGGDRQAWLAQALVVFGCVAATIAVWRGQLPYELKAAGLIVAAMLSTPYLHVYDFPVLMIAAAFLYRQRAFDRLEWLVVFAANLSLLAFLAQLAPIGPVIIALVGGLILRRIVHCSSRAKPLPASPTLGYAEPTQWTRSTANSGPR